MKKNNKKKQTEGFSPIVYEKKPKKNRALIIIISAFLALLLVFGGTLITITAVKNSRFVASSDGFGLDEKCAKYFASAYKESFMRGTGWKDTPEFWASKPQGDEKTYGEHLREGYLQFIKELLVANSLFSSVGSFNDEAEKAVSDSVSFVLDGDEFRGSEAAFNAAVEKYGFDLDSFRAAAELMYRYRNARSSIYGASGELVAADGLSAYFKTYTYAEIIFINDATLSEVKDGVSVADKAEKLSLAIKTYRESAGKGEGSVTDAMFDSYKQYNTIFKSELADCGYYLNANSKFTAEVGNLSGAPHIHDAFKTALDMSVGGYAEIDYDGGVCFIHKKELTEGAYLDSKLERFFSDFSSDAADYLFSMSLSASADKVKIKDALLAVDIISIPYNSYYRTDF